MSDVPVAAFELIGPFEHHDVVVDGHRVPHLEAAPINGGRIWLSLDRRIALDVEVADADRLIPFLADCIAVGMGYTAHPRASEGMTEPIRRPPFPKMTELGDD